MLTWFNKTSRFKPHVHALKNRHGTPTFWYRADDFKARHSQFSTCRRVSVPNVMWHQCSKFWERRDYLPKVVSARVNEAPCQKCGVPCRFFSTYKWGFKGSFTGELFIISLSKSQPHKLRKKYNISFFN